MNEQNLNKSQAAAANHKNGPMMVLAGPGSGKTTVILHRAYNLINRENIPSERILIINFTKAATVQTKIKCDEMLGQNNICVATFHSFFYRILRTYTDIPVESIITEAQKKEIIRSIIAEKGLNYHISDDFIQGVLYEISVIKNDLIDLEYYGSVNMSTDDFKAVYKAYEELKANNRKLDFDDMVEKCHALLSANENILKIWQKKYHYIMIDEFQDVNVAQYNCMKLLCMQRRNIFVVGDDDQSIYRFRGAKPEIMFEFEKDFPECERVILDINYRSTDEIIKFSGRIIRENKKRFNKLIVSDNRTGKKPVIMLSADVGSEALNIGKKILAAPNANLDEICVLYRINTQSRAFIDAFTGLGIPFKVRDEGASVYEHFICKDICAYLELAQNSGDNESILRIINKPNRYVSKDMIREAKSMGIKLLDFLFSSGMEKWQLKKFDELLYELSALRKKPPYEAVKHIRSVIGYDGYLDNYCEYRKMSPAALYEIVNEIMDSAKNFGDTGSFLKHIEEQLVISKKKEKERKDLSGEYGVSLSTIHSAKGMEFEKVFIASCVDGLIPYKRGKTPSDIDEERRLFYVAATRAKDELYISIIRSRFEADMKISPFLDFCKNIAV